MERIGLRLSWETAATIYVNCLEHGTDVRARYAAREELIRMAGLLDKAQRQLSAIDATLTETDDNEADEIRD